MSKQVLECDELDNSGEYDVTPYFQIVGGTDPGFMGMRRGPGSEFQSREDLRASSNYSTTTLYNEILGRDEGSYCWYRVEERADDGDLEVGDIFPMPSKPQDMHKAAFLAKTSTWMQKFVSDAKQQTSTSSTWHLEHEEIRSVKAEPPANRSPRTTQDAWGKTGISSLDLEHKQPEHQTCGENVTRCEHRKRAANSEDASQPEVSETATDRKAVVQKTLTKFQELLERMESELDTAVQPKRRRLDMKVASHMRERKWSLDEDIIGEVEGVEVGDGFNWRAEMSVIGLHKELIAGINVIKRPESEGGPIATSIVFSISSSYSDNIYKDSESEPSIYSGQGGMPSARGSSAGEGYKDQTLNAGNLALKSSFDQKIPIRVIKGVKKVNEDDNRYVYDGLYEIIDYRYEPGVHGNKVYKFALRKLLGQR